ncbi:MAG TPA: hypothetical protein VMS01_04435 [Stellaceae bacterium]|nr:hypothetical protein [Stellaceae bacterium]
MMRHTVRAGCRRCGSGRLAVQVIAWAEYRDGEFERIDLTAEVAPKPRGYALCLDCTHVQPTLEEETAP